MSAILYFYDMYKFETYINGFLDPNYPNVDPKYWLKKLVSFICSVTMFNTILFLPVIYVKLCAIFQPNGGRIDFFFTQMGSLFHIWIPLPD